MRAAFARSRLLAKAATIEMNVRRERAGYTLFELILVIAIIAAAAALSVPFMDAMMTDGRLKASRDMVRARWADIRGRAMKEGRPYKFSTIAGTGKFKIEPEDGNAPADDSEEPPLIVTGELEDKVLFANAGDNQAGSDYQTVVVYLPDGTARQDVRMMFGLQGAETIGLQLRALTGAVSNIDSPTQGNQ
jgi:prepilin-type N-terminal cleavage/methylation domain-containing protein